MTVERQERIPLRRDRDFMSFWLGQSISAAGTGFSLVAVPLLAVRDLGASGAGVGSLRGAVYVPYLVIPLLAGILVDRVRKRPVMIASDVARFVLMLAIPVLLWAGALTFPLLLVIAVVVGCCTVVYEVAQTAYLPLLVSRDRLTAANSWTIASEEAADLVGPGVSGLFVQAAKSAPLAVLVDACSYLVSVISLAAIRKPEPAPEPAGDGRVRADLVEGLRFVFVTSRTVRGIATQGFVFNFGSSMFIVAFLLHALDVQNAGAAWYGVAMTAGGLGALVGATTVAKLIGTLGEGRVYVLSAVASTVPFLLVPVAAGPDVAIGVLWLVALFLANIGAGVWNVMSNTWRQQATPDAMLGRMSGGIRLPLFAGIPLGSILGGLISDAFGPRAALFGCVVIMMLTLPLVPSVLSARAGDRSGEAMTAGSDR
ncbi:MFS transporter [Actinomadura sp. 9N215]|uniref:MFS transporter n=1 Tax=Actinomadura sp. 9N215 TaxID=3375150 RepID=UPI0037B8B4A6